MDLFIYFILFLAFIFGCIVIYKNYLPDNYDKIIKEKKEIIEQLDKEIIRKKDQLNQVNNDDISKILSKLDNLSNNSKNNILPYTFIFISISTILILFFLYKWTYLIHPETLKKIANEASSTFENLMNVFN